MSQSILCQLLTDCRWSVHRDVPGVSIKDHLRVLVYTQPLVHVPAIQIHFDIEAKDNWKVAYYSDYRDVTI